MVLLCDSSTLVLFLFLTHTELNRDHGRIVAMNREVKYSVQTVRSSLYTAPVGELLALRLNHTYKPPLPDQKM